MAIILPPTMTALINLISIIHQPVPDHQDCHHEVQTVSFPDNIKTDTVC